MTKTVDEMRAERAKRGARAKELLIRVITVGKEKLTDAELTDIIAHSEELRLEISILDGDIPYRIEEVIRYRHRKAELETRSTEELRRLDASYRANCRVVDNDGFDDDADDSAFMGSPLDSDKNIVAEILKERGVRA